VPLYNLSKLIAEVALLDYSLAHIPSSQVAAASMYLSSRMLNIEFPKRVFEIMHISMDDVLSVAKKFLQPISLWTSKSAKLQTLYKSYEKLCMSFKSNLLPIEAVGNLLSEDELTSLACIFSVH